MAETEVLYLQMNQNPEYLLPGSHMKDELLVGQSRSFWRKTANPNPNSYYQVAKYSSKDPFGYSPS